MLVTHTAIGLLEAALTGAILVTVLRWRPDLVTGPSGPGTARRPAALAIGFLGLALLVAAFLAPLASRLPDGLERTALDLGFSGHERRWGLPLFGNGTLMSAAFWPLTPVLAGVVGTALAAAVAWGAARSLTRAGDAAHR
jgi:cobalt/nickel transport protein